MTASPARVRTGHGPATTAVVEPMAPEPAAPSQATPGLENRREPAGRNPDDLQAQHDLAVTESERGEEIAHRVRPADAA